MSALHYLHCPDPSTPHAPSHSRAWDHSAAPPLPPPFQCAPFIWIQFRKARGWQTCNGTTDCKQQRSIKGRRLFYDVRTAVSRIHSINSWNSKQHQGSRPSSPAQRMRVGSRTNRQDELRHYAREVATGTFGLDLGGDRFLGQAARTVMMYQWRMSLRPTLSKQGWWSPRRCHASCPAAKRATPAASSSAPPRESGPLIPGNLHWLPGQVRVWRPTCGPVRWAASDHLPGQPSAGHAAAHHLKQPYRGATASRAQLPLWPGVPGLQQQLSDGDLRVHFWESTQAGLLGPLLQHSDPDRGQDVRPLGELGDAEDDGQSGALRNSPGRFWGERGPSGTRCEPKQPDGLQHHLPDRAARPALSGAQREPVELRMRQRGPVLVGPSGGLQVPRSCQLSTLFFLSTKNITYICFGERPQRASHTQTLLLHLIVR